MTRKLLLIIALGAALAIAAAGTAASVNVGNGIQVQTPAAGNLPQCSDLSDNDGDGLVDLQDPGCSGPLDGSEYNAPPAPSGGSGGGSTGGGSPKPAPPAPAASPGGGKGLFGQQNAKKGGPGNPQEVAQAEKQKIEQPGLRNPDGSPTDTNPGLTVAQFGPAPIGVPNFVIDQFEIPPFLLPIYQSCGTEYSIPWQVLASINKIETAFGTNLNVSSAGAVGWMQFLPSTWQAYGVDANNDGRKDPYNPVDAICAAARYLKAAGGDHDLRQAILAYNHADWYADEVLLYANQYGKLPEALVGSLTGLTEGAHFPVAADARYADDINDRAALARSQTQRSAPGNAANVISSVADRRSINIYSSVNAPVVAVNDGVVKKIGENDRLGRYLVLQDAYGNSYTYAQLGSVAKTHAVPHEQALSQKDLQIQGPEGKDATPSAPATAGANDSTGHRRAGAKSGSEGPAPVNTEELRSRLFANPQRTGQTNPNSSSVSGQLDSLLGKSVPGYETFKNYFNDTLSSNAANADEKPLKKGSHVTGGTVLGTVGQPGNQAPHLNFAIRPVGKGAPLIDPKPILDGWKLLETTAIYRAADKNPFDTNASVGQVLLMPKGELEQRVLADPRLSIYACGRQDIESGGIDRRILAVMEYLVAKGYRLTITSLHCGHSYLTSSGNVSAHSYGAAMDIAAVNNIPILGNQGPGTITEAVIRDLMQLQGTMRPAQIISLMNLGPPTFALPDHDDHIHVGFHPAAGADEDLGGQAPAVLKPSQWSELAARLGKIENPVVPATHDAGEDE